jgi:hypothetical protein
MVDQRRVLIGLTCCWGSRARKVTMNADIVAVDASRSPNVVPVTDFDPMPGHTPERPGPVRARAMLGSVQ